MVFELDPAKWMHRCIDDDGDLLLRRARREVLLDVCAAPPRPAPTLLGEAWPPAREREQLMDERLHATRSPLSLLDHRPRSLVGRPLVDDRQRHPHGPGADFSSRASPARELVQLLEPFLVFSSYSFTATSAQRTKSSPPVAPSTPSARHTEMCFATAPCICLPVASSPCALSRASCCARARARFVSARSRSRLA